MCTPTSKTICSSLNCKNRQKKLKEINDRAEELHDDELHEEEQEESFEVPKTNWCGCIGESDDERINGPFYTHLGSAPSLKEFRARTEAVLGISGEAIRFEKICFASKEGKTKTGCPIAKWIIRRSGDQEKVLFIVKERWGHVCEDTVTVVTIVVWEGLHKEMADKSYELISRKVGQFGLAMQRRCAANKDKTCRCQGNNGGASYTFGCSWALYTNSCKYARSWNTIRKFKLTDRAEEKDLENCVDALASHLGPLYQKVAPISFANMTAFDKEAPSCRVGFEGDEPRPFSGATVVADFCAHAHRDVNNMKDGATVIVTLTRPENRGVCVPEDEQLHVLPQYVPAMTDEYGSKEGFHRMIEKGGIDVLTKFERVLVEGEKKKKSYPGKLPSGMRMDDSSPEGPSRRRGKSKSPKQASVQAAAKSEQPITPATKKPRVSQACPSANAPQSKKSPDVRIPTKPPSKHVVQAALKKVPNEIQIFKLEQKSPTINATKPRPLQHNPTTSRTSQVQGKKTDCLEQAMIEASILEPPAVQKKEKPLVALSQEQSKENVVKTKQVVPDPKGGQSIRRQAVYGAVVTKKFVQPKKAIMKRTKGPKIDFLAKAMESIKQEQSFASTAPSAANNEQMEVEEKGKDQPMPRDPVPNAVVTSGQEQVPLVPKTTRSPAVKVSKKPRGLLPKNSQKKGSTPTVETSIQQENAIAPEAAQTPVSQKSGNETEMPKKLRGRPLKTQENMTKTTPKQQVPATSEAAQTPVSQKTGNETETPKKPRGRPPNKTPDNITKTAPNQQVPTTSKIAKASVNQKTETDTETPKKPKGRPPKQQVPTTPKTPALPDPKSSSNRTAKRKSTGKVGTPASSPAIKRKSISKSPSAATGLRALRSKNSIPQFDGEAGDPEEGIQQRKPNTFFNYWNSSFLGFLQNKKEDLRPEQEVVEGEPEEEVINELNSMSVDVEEEKSEKIVQRRDHEDKKEMVTGRIFNAKVIKGSGRASLTIPKKPNGRPKGQTTVKEAMKPKKPRGRPPKYVPQPLAEKPSEPTPELKASPVSMAPEQTQLKTPQAKVPESTKVIMQVPSENKKQRGRKVPMVEEEFSSDEMSESEFSETSEDEPMDGTKIIPRASRPQRKATVKARENISGFLADFSAEEDELDLQDDDEKVSQASQLAKTEVDSKLEDLEDETDSSEEMNEEAFVRAKAEASQIIATVVKQGDAKVPEKPTDQENLKMIKEEDKKLVTNKRIKVKKESKTTNFEARTEAKGEKQKEVKEEIKESNLEMIKEKDKKLGTNKPVKVKYQNEPEAIISEAATPEVKGEKQKEVKEEVKESFSDCRENFLDRNIGGVAISLPHGSVVVECAKRELHATTALKNPNRYNPCRIGMVFYQHRNLNLPAHGREEYLRKMAEKCECDEKKCNEKQSSGKKGKTKQCPEKKRKRPSK